MRAILAITFSILGVTLLKELHGVLGVNGNSEGLPTTWDECLPTSKVVGGDPINITEAPFVLGVESGFPPLSYRFRCGAVIITKKVALTAAHCAESGSATRGQGNIHYVKKIIEHDPSVNSFYDNDIALLFVIEEFVFSDSVQPLKLPEKELETGALAMTAGFGRTSVKPRNPYKTERIDLRRTTVPIVDREICYDVLKKKLLEVHNLTLPNMVTETMVCAGYPGGKYDACEGDSGGPLYLDGVLYGIVAWGIGCALPCAPGVYSNVYGFLDWIDKNIADSKDD